MKLRKLTPADVTFSISIEGDDTPIRGNALASGDDIEDRECEEQIKKRLNDGDLWAWCTVFVTARWRQHEAIETLGCRSYDDEKDFKKGGYYDDMCETALDALNAEIEAEATELAAKDGS